MDIELIRQVDRIHPYPAKYPIDLALEYIEKYSAPGDLVYDPFMGSGTTLLGAGLTDRRSVGTDINHIGVLISQFKLLSLQEHEITDLHAYIDAFEESYQSECMTVALFDYKSISHWFCENSIRVLSYIKTTIDKLSSANEQIFCKLIMSACVNTVSNQESDTRYAAIEKPNLTIEKIAAVYIKKFRTTLALFEKYNQIERNPDCRAILENSKRCSTLMEKESVDLILSSPPYINTYDYYLYHKHRMNWLEYDVNFSMKSEIGSRREFSSLKREESKFNDDLKEIFLECDTVLKPNGFVVLVIGDGQVSGRKYDAKDNITTLCESIGWSLIDHSFTLLDDTSRSFRQSYRTKGKKEHILVFQKGEHHEH